MVYRTRTNRQEAVGCLIYSPAITAQFIEEQQKVTPSFKAEYHSIDAVRSMVELLDEAWDPDTKQPTRNLTNDELLWIENEHLLCTHDFTYYASRYFHIIDAETRRLSLLKPNIAQRIVADVWSEMEEKRWAIMMMQLKARRLGVSTVSAAAVGHRVQFHQEAAALIASSTPAKSDGLVKIIRDAWDYMPWWLMPKATKLQDGCPVEFRGHNATLSIQSGNQFSGIGRGASPSVVWLSEVCEWPNPDEDIDSSLIRSIIPMPEIFFILESTALGRGNWYHRRWKTSKEGWGTAGTQLYPMFLPWYVGCLAPSTPIMMGSGLVKSIKEVEAGDIVTTHTGKPAVVVARILSKRRNEVSSDLWLWGNSVPLSCTRDHKILTTEGWKEAHSIVSGDFVVHPIKRITSSQKEFVLTRLRKSNKRKNPNERHLPFTFEWGRLIGLYLAEGSLSRQTKKSTGTKYIAGVSFACNVKEIDKFSYFIEAATGERPGVGRRSDNNGAELRLNDSPLGRWIDESFGHSDTKRIPGFVWTCGREFARGIVAGYLEGDGHIPDGKLEIAARSVRLQLSIQLRDLIASLGFGWCAITWFPKEDNGKGNRGGWWLHARTSTALAIRQDLEWVVPHDDHVQNKPTHWRYSSDGIAIEVERNLDGFNEEFYDLAIDDADHSFTTLQCAVHNCDIYPAPTWLRQNPVPDSWQPDDRLLAYAKRCEEFVRSHERLRKFMGRHWVMPVEQLWWYYATREEYRQNDNLNQFLAECCSDDIDAFQSTNRSAFSQDIVQAYHDRIKPPLGVYKIIGLGASEDDIPERMRPTSQEIDTSKSRIPIPCDWGHYAGRFELVPVRFEGYSAGRADGNVFIWEWPKIDHEYCFGIDCAEGIGQDRTVIEMIRKDTLIEPDAQVCEWVSAWVNQMELWPIAMALGTLYSTMVQGSRRQAKSSIEVRIMGDAVQWELRKRGWMNHLIWPRALDNKKVDMGRMTKLGFVTNQWSRPYVIGQLLKYVNRELIVINSPYFVEEMEAFSKADDETKIAAEHGEHDDRIMALGFALFALHLLEWKSGNITVHEQRQAIAAGGDPEWSPGFQGGIIPNELPQFGQSRWLDNALRFGGGPSRNRR